MCIVAGEEDSIKNVQEFGFATSSDMMNVSDVDIYAPLKVESSSKYWASQLGLLQAFYQIIFDREYLVKRLKIDWVFPPKKFAVEFMDADGNWSEMKQDLP